VPNSAGICRRLGLRRRRKGLNGSLAATLAARLVYRDRCRLAATSKWAESGHEGPYVSDAKEAHVFSGCQMSGSALIGSSARSA
jgi:hypothetical protein